MPDNFGNVPIIVPLSWYNSPAGKKETIPSDQTSGSVVPGTTLPSNGSSSINIDTTEHHMVDMGRIKDQYVSITPGMTIELGTTFTGFNPYTGHDDTYTGATFRATF